MSLFETMKGIFKRKDVPMIPKADGFVNEDDPFFSVSLDQMEQEIAEAEATGALNIPAEAIAERAPVDEASSDATEATASEIDAMETIVVGSDVEFDEGGHATVLKDGVEYEVYDMSARMGMKAIELPTDADEGEDAGTDANGAEATKAADDDVIEVADDSEPATEEVAEGVADATKDETPVTPAEDAPAEDVAETEVAEDVPAAPAEEVKTTDEGVTETPDATSDDCIAIAFREGDEIVPLGFERGFVATSAVEPMLAKWHVRAVNETDMPNYADEPIIELYDGETGEFVSSYWVSQICDDSEENEGMGIACKGGADKRYRIAYNDLVTLKGLVRSDATIAKWLTDHEGDMPDHNI